MHHWGHIACHEGYNMNRLHPDEVMVEAWQSADGLLKFPAVTIKTLNSQAAEQCNAKLKAVRTQCAYMNQDNYMMFIKYFLMKKNEQLIKKKA
jgi:hypothetical protein